MKTKESALIVIYGSRKMQGLVMEFQHSSLSEFDSDIADCFVCDFKSYIGIVGED